MIISDTVNIPKFQQGQLRQIQLNRQNEAGKDAKPLQLVSGSGAGEVETAGNRKGGTAAVSPAFMQQDGDSNSARQSVERLEKTISMIKHNKLEFSIHEETGRTVVKIVDQDTGKVIKQLPPEELLDLAAKLEEMSGVLFDKKI